jgi:enterochelin esterase-like enzyme
MQNWLIVVTAFFFALCSVMIGTQAQTTCGETTGRTERDFHYASDIQTRIYYTVYLPACYDQTDDSYPVIYLMHGSNEDDGQWGRLGLFDLLDEGIARGEYPPVIAVMPFAEWVGNENRFDRYSWSGVFRDGVMPLLEDTYRIDTGRRAIGGISRGGFWAFHFAFRDPAMFDAVGGHSAFFDLYHAPPEENPLHLASDGENVDTLRIWLDHGVDDYALPGLEIMHERLSERGVAHLYTVKPQGEHNNAYWGQHIAEYVQFYMQGWQSDVQPEPTATHPPALFVTNTPRPTPQSDLGLLPTPTVPAPVAELAPTTAPSSADDNLYLLLPAIAFGSRQANMTGEQLANIRAGLLDPRLVLSTDVAGMLALDYGINVAEGTRLVEPGALLNTLSRDGTLYTLLPFDRLTPRYRVLRVDETHPLDADLAEYPFAFASDTPNFYPVRLTRIAMSGVTALTREMLPALDREGVEWAASGIQDYVTAADFFHTSNEVSFHPACPSMDVAGRLGAFCSKPAHFELLTLLDLDIVELSGNHNNDYGYDAYNDTLQWYVERGIAPLGGGETLEDAQRPLLIEHHGNRIALLACNWAGPYYAQVNENEGMLGGVRPGAAPCERDWLQITLPVLAEENDLVIVSSQHFEFDEFTPRPQIQSDYRELVGWGADVVVGTHSHFPQTFEFAGEGFIHYGLGNLYFDQEFFGGVRFFIDQFFIYEGRLLTVDLFTGIIEDQGRPRPMTADERENFLFLILTQYGGM